MAGLRTSALRHDKGNPRTVYNCILRLHLLQNDYESAGIFWRTVPSLLGSTNLNNQSARYHFYRARIAAVVGNYFEAAEDLSQALRKVPHGHFALLNFILSATKFSIVVQLLRGEILIVPLSIFMNVPSNRTSNWPIRPFRRIGPLPTSRRSSHFHLGFRMELKF